MATPSVKANTVRSTATSSRRGTSPGARATSACVPAHASSSPATAATVPCSNPSVSVWQTIRHRVAPNAARIDVSSRAGAATRQKHGGDIGTGNQEDDGDDGKQQVQHQADVADRLIVKAGDEDAFLSVGFWILLFEPTGNRVEFGLRLFDGRRLFQSADRQEVLLPAIGMSR